MSWSATHDEPPPSEQCHPETRPMHRKTAYSWDEEKLPNDLSKPPTFNAA